MKFPNVQAIQAEIARQAVAARGRIPVKYAVLSLIKEQIDGHIVPKDVEKYIDDVTEVMQLERAENGPVWERPLPPAATTTPSPKSLQDRADAMHKAMGNAEWLRDMFKKGQKLDLFDNSGLKMGMPPLGREQEQDMAYLRQRFAEWKAENKP